MAVKFPSWGLRAEGPTVPRRPLQGFVRVRPPQTFLSFSPEVLRRVALRNIESFERCYTEGLARDPSLAGQVELGLLIHRNAGVVRARVGASTLPDLSVATCMAAVPLQWSVNPRRSAG